MVCRNLWIISRGSVDTYLVTYKGDAIDVTILAKFLRLLAVGHLLRHGCVGLQAILEEKIGDDETLVLGLAVMHVGHRTNDRIDKSLDGIELPTLLVVVSSKQLLEVRHLKAALQNLSAHSQYLRIEVCAW